MGGAHGLVAGKHRDRAPWVAERIAFENLALVSVDDDPSLVAHARLVAQPHARADCAQVRRFHLGSKSI